MENRGGYRAGAGRKSKGAEPRIQFSCLLSEQNKEFIKRQAQETGLSNSDVINIIIDAYRDENDDKKVDLSAIVSAVS